MNKTVKNTAVILFIIAASISLGYAYDKANIYFGKRANPLKYEDIVEKYSEEYGVAREIIFAVINIESGFRSDAESLHAVGLMQITPDTFDWLMTRTGENLSDGLLYDPETNIKYGTYYLRYLYDRFKEWDIAFAAYNAGPNRVNGWLSNPEYIQDNKIVYIPIEETRNYVKKVNKSREAYKKLYFSGN